MLGPLTSLRDFFWCEESEKKDFFLYWDISRLPREHLRKDKTQSIVLAPRHNRPWGWHCRLATTCLCHPKYPSWLNVCSSAPVLLRKPNIRGRCLKGKWEALGAPATAHGLGRTGKAAETFPLKPSSNLSQK